MLLFLCAGPAAGQQGAVAPDSARHGALFTGRDAALAAAFVVGTPLVGQLDRTVAEHLQDPAHPPTGFTTHAADFLNFVGIPGSVLLPGGMFVVGRLAHRAGLADAGLHVGEAVVAAELQSYVLKYAFGRERPFLAGTKHPGEFAFGRGFKGDAYASFPSGHATAAFAAAAALSAEVARQSPAKVVWVAPLAYGTAALVGWARLETNNHWLSDVFLGAGIGTVTGILTVRWNHQHPGNWFSRIFLAAAPGVSLYPGGYAVTLRWKL